MLASYCGVYFSLDAATMVKKRESFLFELVASILTLAYNFNEVACSQFYDIAKVNSSILRKAKGTAKYS